MDHNWTDEQMAKAQTIVMERFALNSVAGHLAPHSTIDDKETTVPRNRFDFDKSVVVDRETFGLYEPYAYCLLTKAQVDEFSAAPSDQAALTKAATTFTRAANDLARWHDVLFFFGRNSKLKPKSVLMPDPTNPPQSLHEAAREAEQQTGVQPISVVAPPNEGLVAAVYEAVLRLEARGYYTAYHLVLGEQLWQELHRPTPGSLVLPRDRIEPTLLGGGFYRTTTLPSNEALLTSLDGATFDCVIAGDPAQHPRLEWLRVEERDGEQLYLFRVRERFAPRVRENQAIVRLIIQSQ